MNNELDKELNKIDIENKKNNELTGETVSLSLQDIKLPVEMKIISIKNNYQLTQYDIINNNLDKIYKVLLDNGFEIEKVIGIIVNNDYIAIKEVYHENI